MALISRLLATVATLLSLAFTVAVLVTYGPGAPAAHAGAAYANTMAHYAFGPAQMSVHVGDSITWTNTDAAPHDVTTTSAPVAIHSPTITTGQSWSYTFTVPGPYLYICSIHPDMHAALTVEAGTPQLRTSSPRAGTVAPAAAANVATSFATAREPASLTTRATVPGTVAKARPSTAPANRQPVLPTATTTIQTASTASGSRLKPLLLVAGLIAAVATLCLLMLATAPKDPL
jgi:plastocyanin